MAENNGAVCINGYLYNLQGDVVALVDGTGTKVVEYTYDAWGKPTGKTGTLAGTLGTVQPFRYRGYVFDEETGNYYLRSRYYRPEWCRFLSADSVFDGTNLYRYCRNNPGGLSDHDGYAPKVPYDPIKAVAFALDNYDKMNEWSDRFYYEKDNNCARFVSACVFAGLGNNDFEDWHDYHFKEKNNVTPSWRLAKKQYEYFLESEYCGYSYDLDPELLVGQIGYYMPVPGDLMYKQYEENGKEKWHAVIITEVTDEMIYYTGNSFNRKNEPVTTLWERGENIKIHVISMYSINCIYNDR